MSDTSFDRSVLGFEAAILLETLLKQADGAGRAQVPTSALLEASSLSQGALMRARTELTQRGLLRTESGFSASGLRGANVYAVNLAALGSDSSSLPGGEAGQNRTGEASITMLPGVSEVRGASSGPESGRAGFLARMFRRSRPS